MIVWGVHRDTRELVETGFPIFSYGTCPAGPQRLDPREIDALRTARFGNHELTNEDIVLADADGILFIPTEQVDEVFSTAYGICEKERHQAQLIRNGRKLREQLQFDKYLLQRERNDAYTFRQHLRSIGGAIEE